MAEDTSAPADQGDDGSAIILHPDLIIHTGTPRARTALARVLDILCRYADEQRSAEEARTNTKEAPTP